METKQNFTRNLGDVYKNDGNRPLLNLAPSTARRVLDVGCGAGDNARMFRRQSPEVHIIGITLSPAEAQLARRYIQEVHVADLETTDFEFLGTDRFDLVIFSHVLEHLRYPDVVLQTLSERVEPNGHFLIAVPNVVEWRNRVRMLRGMFDYEDGGVMDRTHLRFFTWRTINSLLLEPLEEFELITKRADGAVPLWFLRRILPMPLVQLLDRCGSHFFPNLLGGQIIVLAQRRGGA
jgi:2-polyprenyl-3-methyl-5-hydroxy-6-metoxy-1,4-benzoquinol methylase